jgi:hypothetical protein
MLDIALVSGRTGTINCNVACGLLIECLQDVSSIILMLPFWLFVAWLVIFCCFLL